MSICTVGSVYLHRNANAYQAVEDETEAQATSLKASTVSREDCILGALDYIVECLNYSLKYIGNIMKGLDCILRGFCKTSRKPLLLPRRSYGRWRYGAKTFSK